MAYGSTDQSPEQPAATCHCGRPARRLVAPTVEMEVDAAGLRVDGVVVDRCATGHATVADDDLAERIVAAVDERLLVSRSRMLRSDDACGDCGGVLSLPGRATEVPVPFTAPSGVVTPTLAMTMVRCPDCGRDQVPASVRDVLPALAAAAVRHAATTTG